MEVINYRLIFAFGEIIGFSAFVLLGVNYKQTYILHDSINKKFACSSSSLSCLSTENFMSIILKNIGNT